MLRHGEQYIFGGASPVSLSRSGVQLLKSSRTIVEDYAEGSSGNFEGPILCSFKAVPIAFYEVPTLNMMVFSRALWERLLKNDYLKKTMEEGSHWGEGKHADRDEVWLSESACRVNRFWIASNNFVLGDVDILNTPNGRPAYTLAKIGKIGISSRGFGVLRDRGDGLKDVVPEDYTHVCWDLVSFPAVPDASMTLITGDDGLVSTEMDNMSSQLRSLINEAWKRSPAGRAVRASGGATRGRIASSGEKVSQAVLDGFFAQKVKRSLVEGRKND